jgi:hypothetical protein
MSASVLIEAVEAEGFGGGGVVAPAFGAVQVAGVLEGRDDRGADGGQVGGPAGALRCRVVCGRHQEFGAHGDGAELADNQLLGTGRVKHIPGLESSRIVRVVVVGKSPTSIFGEVTNGFRKTVFFSGRRARARIGHDR